MKKILFLIAFVLVFTGCELKRSETIPVDTNGMRFQVTYSQNLEGVGMSIHIFIDKNTGTKYLFYRDCYGCGLIKLEE